jgi:ribosomal protein S18 acetylase RimI-like enzyme
MNPQVTEPSAEAEAELNAFLDHRIYEFNIRCTGFADGKAFASVIKDEAEAVVAAINGHSWGGCCYVAHLWVQEERRRQGIGRALLEATEEEAKNRGCTQVLLLTHSFQAPAFYERLGYQVQATIANYPQGHAQYVFVKKLPASGASAGAKLP